MISTASWWMTFWNLLGTCPYTVSMYGIIWLWISLARKGRSPHRRKYPRKTEPKKKTRAWMTKRSWNSPRLIRTMQCVVKTVPLSTFVYSTWVSVTRQTSLWESGRSKTGTFHYMMNSLRASSHMYCLGYSRCTLSVTFHPGVSIEYVSKSSTGGMIVCCQVLTDVANVFFLDGFQLPKKVRQLRMEGGLRWIQPHIHVRIIAQ